MTTVGRNDPCPCGSKKKYKHCYDAPNSVCVLRIQDDRKKMMEEHDKREKEIMGFFMEVTEETTVISLKDDKGNDMLPIRIQIITIFSLIDVLASYWYEYQNKTGKTNERAQLWYDNFCTTEKNINYKGTWKELTSNRLYTFRNALVHFFGFGEITEGVSIILVQNNLAEETRKQWEERFLKRGHKTIVIKPLDFHNLVKEGALLMLEGWGSVIKEAQTDRSKEAEYIDGIRRVWNKVRKEGAVRVT